MWRCALLGLAMACGGIADAAAQSGSARSLVVRSTAPSVLIEASAELQVQGSYSLAQHGDTVFIDASATPLLLGVPADWALHVEDGAGGLTVLRRSGATHITDGAGDLLVVDPAELRIDDKGGDIAIEQTDASSSARIRIVDGSGAIRVTGVRGFLSIVDSAGDIAVTDFSGQLDIEDGSGHLVGQDWRGTARLRDGSGDIRILRAEHVMLLHDGSGLRQFEGVQRLEQRGAP